MASVCAVVPVERYLKDELSRMKVFQAEERASLALAMLEDVVVALKSVPEVDGRVIVPSGDPEALELAHRLGVWALEYQLDKNTEGDLNHALRLGIDMGIERFQANGALFLASDVPLVRTNPQRISRMLQLDTGDLECVAIWVASRGGGITARYTRPPLAIESGFPSPALKGPSLAEHEHEASESGCNVIPFDSFILSADMDVDDDLIDVFIQGRKTRTYEVLLSLPYRFEVDPEDNRRLRLRRIAVA